MHEMSIAESILSVALSEAEKHDSRKIKSITLEIGKLRQVIPETLEFCFGIMSKDTLAEGASLTIEEIPIKAHCPHCSQDIEIDDYVFICPDCAKGNLNMLQGDEMILAHMELE